MNLLETVVLKNWMNLLKTFVLKNWKIISILLLIGIGISVMLRYVPFFVLFIFTAICGFIKFKRQTMELPFALEPLYLCSCVLTYTYGLSYGLFIVFFPNIIAEVLSGKLSGGIVMNLVNKSLVNVIVYYFATQSNVIPLILISVLITDIISFPININLGKPIHDVIGGGASNFFIRFMYVTTLFRFLTGLLSGT